MGPQLPMSTFSLCGVQPVSLLRYKRLKICGMGSQAQLESEGSSFYGPEVTIVLFTGAQATGRLAQGNLAPSKQPTTREGSGLELRISSSQAAIKTDREGEKQSPLCRRQYMVLEKPTQAAHCFNVNGALITLSQALLPGNMVSSQVGPISEHSPPW